MAASDLEASIRDAGFASSDAIAPCGRGRARL